MTEDVLLEVPDTATFDLLSKGDAVVIGDEAYLIVAKHPTQRRTYWAKRFPQQRKSILS